MKLKDRKRSKQQKQQSKHRYNTRFKTPTSINDQEYQRINKRYLIEVSSMSQSMFEIRRVFQAQRAELSKVNEGQYTISNGVREFGVE